MPNPYYNPYWLDSDFLEHHGVKGQSWGEKNGPPYPLSRGKDGRVTQTQKKKKQSLLARAKTNHQKKVKAKERAKKAAERKKQKAKEAEENLSKEELREKLLKSTDPKFIAKHVDLLDTREIKDRLDRIDTEQKLKNLIKDDKNKKKVDKGMKFATDLAKNVATIADATSKAAKAYNDVVDATDKQNKVKREKIKAQTEAEKLKYEKENSKQQFQTNVAASKKILSMLDDYKSAGNDLSDIEINFDPKSGNLSFKTKKK